MALLLWLWMLAPADTSAVDTTAREDAYRLKVGCATLSGIPGQVRKALPGQGLAAEPGWRA